MCIGSRYSLGYCKNNAIQCGKVRIVDAFPHGVYIDGQRLRHCTRPKERVRETGTTVRGGFTRNNSSSMSKRASGVWMLVFI